MIFVIAEHNDNKLKPITSELLVFAQRVGRDFGQPITAVVMSANTGALAGELKTRKIDRVITAEDQQLADYNPDVGTLTIREAKSGHVRHVTLTDEAPELIERLIAGRSPDDCLLSRDDARGWKRAEQLRPMRDACTRAAIVPAVGFHVLRHTHASILAMRGVPMAVIARQLGHSDTRMTERHYAHLAPNYVTDTIRANFPRLTASAATVVSIGHARTKQSKRA